MLSQIETVSLLFNWLKCKAFQEQTLGRSKHFSAREIRLSACQGPSAYMGITVRIRAHMGKSLKLSSFILKAEQKANMKQKSR